MIIVAIKLNVRNFKYTEFSEIVLLKICIIKNIKTSYSRAHDGISSVLLKLIAGDISKCIMLIINQSLHSGFFPDKLKITKVPPIHKKCDSKLIKDQSLFAQ